MLHDRYFGFPPLLKKANKVLQRWRVLVFYRIAPCLRWVAHACLIPPLSNTYPSRNEWLSSGSNLCMSLYNIPTTKNSEDQKKQIMSQLFVNRIRRLLKRTSATAESHHDNNTISNLHMNSCWMILLSLSSRSSVDRAPARCSGGHGFYSCISVGELRFFLCPTLLSCWSIHLSHYL